MVKIEAIIRQNKLEDVQDALTELHVSGMTVLEVKGMGRQKGVTHTYRGSQYTLSLTPKIMLILVVLDHEVDAIVSAIQSAAETGEVGDGKIFVSKVDQAVRIRTDERGDVVLQ
jgi:nitrogen regulatory protein P-II 1